MQDHAMRYGEGYVPDRAIGVPFTQFGIDAGRHLMTRERNRVMVRFLTWTESFADPTLRPPVFDELRWSDNFTYLYVPKASGLLAFGFTSLYPEHGPVAEDQNWAIYSADNPAAQKLLSAIKEVTRRDR